MVMLLSHNGVSPSRSVSFFIQFCTRNEYCTVQLLLTLLEFLPLTLYVRVIIMTTYILTFVYDRYTRNSAFKISYESWSKRFRICKKSWKTIAFIIVYVTYYIVLPVLIGLNFYHLKNILIFRIVLYYGFISNLYLQCIVFVLYYLSRYSRQFK